MSARLPRIQGRRSAAPVRRAIVLLAALALGGCAKHARVAPTASAPPPPPGILAVSPTPRSVFTDYAADIWAECAEDLDAATVTTRNVYLKLDTVRIPISVSWEPATRRIHLRPLVTLALLTTYTVELSPNLESAAGVPLGTAYRWQFTTTSVRHPSAPFPADRSVESPFTTLAWAGNETTPGALAYEVYVGPDSMLVAARTQPFVYRGARALVLPRTRWIEHGANFWSVTIDNATAGERSNGPVWRFDTPVTDAPIDSVAIAASVFGYRRTGGNTGGCSTPELLAGGGYFAGIVWALNQQPQTLRLAGVRMDLTATPPYADSLPGDVSVWLTNAAMGCNTTALTSFLTDEVNGHLASGTLIGPRRVRFESDTLIAHIQASIRLRTFFGYMFRAKPLIHFESPQGVEPAAAPVLKLYYYTSIGTLPSVRAAGTPARKGPASPARGRPGFFPLDPRGVQSVNSR
jgi:hypothetical protein